MIGRNLTGCRVCVLLQFNYKISRTLFTENRGIPNAPPNYSFPQSTGVQRKPSITILLEEV